MSQPDPNQPKKTNASAAASAPKAGTQKQPASSGKSFWYVILLLVVVAVFAGYWVQQKAEEPRPVVSAAEGEGRAVTSEPEGESSSAAAALVVTSDVRGADVYLNGSRVGKTPHKATPLEPGDYDVKVMHDGYETFEEQVRVDTKDDSFHATLTPNDGEPTGETNAPEEAVAPADIRGLGDTVAVKHKHRIGSCEGVLRADDEGLHYETDHKDAFFAAYANLEELALDKSKLKLKVRDGKKYDFSEQNDDQDAVAAFHARAQGAVAKTESANE